MRNPFPKIVERGRMRDSFLGMVSEVGDPFGAFHLKSPVTGHRMFTMVADGKGWDHVSVSHSNRKRLPTWAEMCWIKSLFFKPEECVVQYHPPASSYVNDTQNVLHLWRSQDAEIPMPPVICV